MNQERPSNGGAGRPGDTDARIADLMAVLEVSRQLGGTVELQPLLESIERSALRVLDCERATVFLLDRDRNELFSRVATGVSVIRFAADRGIAGEVARTSAVVNVPDAYSDPRFNPEIDRQTGFRTHNLLTFPLLGYDNAVVGVLQVLNKRGGAFDAWDEELVRTFGAQAGVAVQRQLLLEHFAEKQRIEHDLSVARSIQQALIPQESPQAPGFDVAGWNRPADETGGDCFDFLALPDGGLAVTVADATGHGIGPALMIAECRALLRATLSMTHDLKPVVEIVNRLLCVDLPDNRFVTAFCGVLEPPQHSLAYLSAGHAPILFFEAATGDVRDLEVNGVPLGIVADMPYDAPHVVRFEPGDMVIVLTDGLSEWANPHREMFGTQRIGDVVRAFRSAPAAEIITRIYEAVLAFGEGTPQKDDLTGLIIKRL